MIIHTRLLPVAGFAPFPWLVLINEQHRGDPALLAHEQVHVAQMRRDGWLSFWLRYATRAGRQAYEVEAYRAQIAAGASLEACARNLVSMYWLGIDLPRARELLA